MKGNSKTPRSLISMGMAIGMAVLLTLVPIGVASAASASASNQSLINSAGSLVARVTASIPHENALGRDTTQLQAAAADVQEILSMSVGKAEDLDDVGEASVAGADTDSRTSDIQKALVDFSDRNTRWTDGDAQDYRVALRDATNQLKQTWDNFKAAFPADFATTTAAATPASSSSSSSSSSSTSTSTTTPAAAAATSTLNAAQRANITIYNDALGLIAKAQAEIITANARGLDTSTLQAAVADLTEITSFGQSITEDKIEGAGVRNSPIIVDFSERNNARWMDGDARDYRVVLRDSWFQLKNTLDAFVAANP